MTGLTAAVLLFYACNESNQVASVHTQATVLTSATINPEKISFSSVPVKKDTSIDLTFTVSVSDTSVLQGSPHFVISDIQSDTTVAQGIFHDFDPASSTFKSNIPLTVKTTEFAQYQVYIFGIDKHNQLTNSFRSMITVYGAVGKPPVVLMTENPDTVKIPTGSTITYIDFKAKVTDPDGQSNIDSVLVNLVSQNTGKRLNGSPFMLYDDGSSQSIGNSNSGDAVKGDSVYTRRFQVSSNNTPDKLTVSYYAVDKTGLHSDTTVSHLVFVN